MTEETKERLKSVMKILFFPITGFYFLISECKNDDYQNFYTEWFVYILMFITWCCCISIIPISIIGGGIIVFFVLPAIIHKLIHRK